MAWFFQMAPAFAYKAAPLHKILLVDLQPMAISLLAIQIMAYGLQEVLRPISSNTTALAYYRIILQPEMVNTASIYRMVHSITSSPITSLHITVFQASGFRVPFLIFPNEIAFHKISFLPTPRQELSCRHLAQIITT